MMKPEYTGCPECGATKGIEVSTVGCEGAGGPRDTCNWARCRCGWAGRVADLYRDATKGAR